MFGALRETLGDGSQRKRFLVTLERISVCPSYPSTQVSISLWEFSHLLKKATSLVSRWRMFNSKLRICKSYERLQSTYMKAGFSITIFSFLGPIQAYSVNIHSALSSIVWKANWVLFGECKTKPRKPNTQNCFLWTFKFEIAKFFENNRNLPICLRLIALDASIRLCDRQIVEDNKILEQRRLSAQWIS